MRWNREEARKARNTTLLSGGFGRFFPTVPKLNKCRFLLTKKRKKMAERTNDFRFSVHNTEIAYVLLLVLIFSFPAVRVESLRTSSKNGHGSCRSMHHTRLWDVVLCLSRRLLLNRKERLKSSRDKNEGTYRGGKGVEEPGMWPRIWVMSWKEREKTMCEDNKWDEQK